jgi:hypothetical protein
MYSMKSALWDGDRRRGGVTSEHDRLAVARDAKAG